MGKDNKNREIGTDRADLGYAALQTTMDTYVHVIDESKLLAVKLFEKNDSEAPNEDEK